MIPDPKRPFGEHVPVMPVSPREGLRQLVLFLDLLGAPALVGLAHIGGRLDGGDELEDGVGDTDEADDGASDDAQGTVVEQDGTDKDVKGTATDEGEEEGRVARDLRRDLELEERSG